MWYWHKNNVGDGTYSVTCSPQGGRCSGFQVNRRWMGRLCCFHGTHWKDEFFSPDSEGALLHAWCSTSSSGKAEPFCNKARGRSSYFYRRIKTEGDLYRGFFSPHHDQPIDFYCFQSLPFKGKAVFISSDCRSDFKIILDNLPKLCAD